jgi:hypothetical protein
MTIEQFNALILEARYGTDTEQTKALAELIRIAFGSQSMFRQQRAIKVLGEMGVKVVSQPAQGAIHAPA